jgi:protein-disulfide isomerase
MRSSIALFALALSAGSLFADGKPSQNPPQKGESFLEKLKKMEIPDELKLSEVIIGDENAKNTIIVYSSFTCSHCSAFHNGELSKLKEKYADTGKAKIYLRNYVDDPGSLEAATLVRYFGGSSTPKVLDLTRKVFGKQKEWLASKDPKQFLRKMFADFGFDEKEIEKHVADTKVGAGLMKEQQKASEELKISLIPAFIVNGKKHQGKLSAEEVEKML